MGGYTSKCEKKSKSLHPNEELLSELFSGKLSVSTARVVANSPQR
jgi:hypothetical protein